jgi:hypothetical protein
MCQGVYMGLARIYSSWDKNVPSKGDGPSCCGLFPLSVCHTIFWVGPCWDARRISTLAYCATGFLFYSELIQGHLSLHANNFVVAPVQNCNILVKSMAACYVVAFPSTSAMLFFRARAVYGNNKTITLFFGFMLFALFGLSFVIPVVLEATKIGTTQRCINTPTPHYISTPIILNSVIDTLLFIAISVRIVSYSSTGNTFGARVESFFRGKGLPALSKTLLQGCQLYYL